MSIDTLGQHGHGSARWWVLAGLWLVYFTFGLVVTSIAPLVAMITTDLSMSNAAMGSIMGAWQLVYIFAAVPCGILLDRLGGRRALLIGLAFLLISIYGRSVAIGYWTFLLAVMVFGLGGPIISSGAPKLVAELFAGPSRGMAMGIYMTGPAMGSVVSLSLTHALFMPWVDGDWRMVMQIWAFVVLCCGFVWLLIGWRFLPAHEVLEATERPRQLDVMMSLLRMPSVQLVLFMAVGVFLLNHGLNNWLVELLRHGGMSPTTAGYWATIPTLVGIVGSLVIPRLATPPRRFGILFALCLAAALASALLMIGDPLPLGVGLILQGVARSSMMTVLILSLVELPGIGEARAGVASGMFFAAAEIGGVVGPLGIGVIYDLQGGFDLALIILTGVAVLMAFGAIWLGRVARQKQQSNNPQA